MAEQIKYLDYEGLKTLVQSIVNEIPIADGETIVNKNGKLSAKINVLPTIDENNGIMAFTNSPVTVSDGTLFLAKN